VSRLGFKPELLSGLKQLRLAEFRKRIESERASQLQGVCRALVVAGDHTKRNES
jgi:hypothetical protein